MEGAKGPRDERGSGRHSTGHHILLRQHACYQNRCGMHPGDKLPCYAAAVLWCAVSCRLRWMQQRLVTSMHCTSSCPTTWALCCASRSSTQRYASRVDRLYCLVHTALFALLSVCDTFCATPCAYLLMCTAFCEAYQIRLLRFLNFAQPRLLLLRFPLVAAFLLLLPQSKALHQKALQMALDKFGVAHATTTLARGNLVDALDQLGEREEARRLLNDNIDSIKEVCWKWNFCN